MPTTSLSAEDIAERQLLTALRLWRESDFLSALTLAGAAEEILGKRLRKLGREPSFDQLKNAIVTLTKRVAHPDQDIERMVGEHLNQTRNELKHFAGEDKLSFDLRADAAEMLERAIANYRLLTGNLPTDAMQFWADISDT